MYVIEGSPAEAIGGIITTEVALFPADRCVWRTTYNSGFTVTDSGRTTTSADPDNIVIAGGNYRSEFPVGTVVSPNADGSGASTVLSTHFESGDTRLSMEDGTFIIGDSIYIVATGVQGYEVAEAEFCPPGGTSYTAISNPTLGYVGKSGRFVAITI